MSAPLERTTLIFDAVDGPFVAVLAVVALAALIVLGVRSVQNLGRPRAAALVGLRVTLAVLVVLMALRPLVRREHLSVTAVPLAIVVDASGSMAVRDQAGGTSRLEALAAWARRHGQELDALGERAVVDWFTTSDGALRAASRQALETGRVEGSGGTDLAGALESLVRRYAGRPRPAVLLLSDGADRGALDDLLSRGALDAELGSLGPGGAVVSVVPEPGGFADLAVDLVAHDPVGFLRTHLTLRVRIRSVGLPEADVPVSLMRGEEVVQVRSVRLGGDGTSSAELTFQLEPVRVGELLFRVEVPVRAGEAVAANNEAVFSVRVVRDRIRVLQVVGRPSWDGRFLRELLKRDPAIDLISFFILRSSWDDPIADVDELSLIPFPVNELFGEKLDGFDLVVFQNFNFRPYGIQPYLGSVRRHVLERGGGLAVIGGDLAFGADYRTGALADVLPVEASRSARWEDRRLTPRPTDAARRHPVFRLGPAGSDSASGDAAPDLLPVRGVNLGLAPVPDSLVLLESADAEHVPLLVTSEPGEGRSLVLATDGSWGWSLPAAGLGMSPRFYERFWESAIRWLVRDPRSELLLLECDRRAVGPGESVEIRVHVRTEDYRPQAATDLVVEVSDAGGDVVHAGELQTDQAGLAVVSWEPRVPGLYAVRARSGRGEAGPLFVERVDESQELADAAVDRTLLESLADATGGSVQATSGPFPDMDFVDERHERVESASVQAPWRSWPAWALVAGLLSLEWWLRRRWGLA